MSRFEVGEKVYVTGSILANVQVVLAIKQRRFLHPLYLVATSAHSGLKEWVSESRLSKIAPWDQELAE